MGVGRGDVEGMSRLVACVGCYFFGILQEVCASIEERDQSRELPSLDWGGSPHCRERLPNSPSIDRPRKVFTSIACGDLASTQGSGRVWQQQRTASRLHTPPRQISTTRRGYVGAAEREAAAEETMSRRIRKGERIKIEHRGAPRGETRGPKLRDWSQSIDRIPRNTGTSPSRVPLLRPSCSVGVLVCRSPCAL